MVRSPNDTRLTILLSALLVAVTFTLLQPSNRRAMLEEVAVPQIFRRRWMACWLGVTVSPL
jgi:hypothetical protein